MEEGRGEMSESGYFKVLNPGNRGGHGLSILFLSSMVLLL